MSPSPSIQQLSRRDRRAQRYRVGARKLSTILLAGSLLAGAAVGTASTVFLPASSAQAVSLGAGVWFGGNVGAGSFIHSNGSIVYCAELGRATVMGNNPAMGATAALPAYNAASYSINGQTFTNVGTGELSGAGLQQFNWILARYGSTADNNQAAAVQIALWKLRAAGSSAGYQQALAYMESGVGAGVVALANQMVTDAAGYNGSQNAPNDPRIVMTGPYRGHIEVDPGTTSLTLGNAIFTATGTNTITFPTPTTGVQQVPFEGRPPYNGESWDRYYPISVNGTYQYEVIDPTVSYGSPGGLGQGLVASAPARTEIGNYDGVEIDPDTIWSPSLSTQVPSKYRKKDQAFSDTVTFGVAPGSNPWRESYTSAGEKRYAPIVAKGTLYGPFLADPALNPSGTPPVGAPVAARAEIRTDPLTGPGTYEVSAGKAKESGYYTWVWDIRFEDQLASVQNPVSRESSLPAAYYFTDGFGQITEGQIVPTDLVLSTELKNTKVFLKNLTLTDLVTAELVEGGWLQGADGNRVPAKVRLTAYGETGKVEKSPMAPQDAVEISRTIVDVSEPKTPTESPAMEISLEDFKRFNGGAVQACILDEDQPEEVRGHFTETCDEYGAKGEIFEFVKPAISTKAQTSGSLGEQISDTAIVKDSDLPEGSTIGATAYLRPKAGDFKYDENWKSVLGQDGKPVKWTQAELDALSPEALCEVQPVGKTERVPAGKQGEYELPGITVGSEGTGIDWVEDTVIPHPKTGEPVEWSRGKCGVAEEHTKLPKPKVTTQVQLPEAYPVDTNWDNVIVADLAPVTEKSPYRYETVVDAFYTKDAAAKPVCAVDEKVWTSKAITVTGSGTVKTDEYLISDVLPKGAESGRLDHVEKLIRIEKETGERTVIAEGECGAASESTIVKPKPALAVTGSAGWMALAATGGALALGGVMLLALRQRRKTFALAGAVRSCGDEVASE